MGLLLVMESGGVPIQRSYCNICTNTCISPTLNRIFRAKCQVGEREREIER